MLEPVNRTDAILLEKPGIWSTRASLDLVTYHRDERAKVAWPRKILANTTSRYGS